MDSLENNISSGIESENDSSTYEDSSSDSTTSSEENLDNLDLENFLNNDEIKNEIMETSSEPEKNLINPLENALETPWVLWFHKTKDIDWSANSFIQLYEMRSIQDFWRLYSNWEECLPNIETNMYFIMRKGILPMWEDKHNITGGSWSVKITRNNVFSAWTELSMALIGETITDNNDLSKIVNGISISPKKYFCIVKIWNNDNSYNTDDVISKNIPFLDLSKMLYKSNNSNIEMDKKKMKLKSISS